MTAVFYFGFAVGVPVGALLATLLGGYLYSDMHRQAVQNNKGTVQLLGWTVRDGEARERLLRDRIRDLEQKLKNN